MMIKKVILQGIAAGSIIVAGAVAPVTDRLVEFVQGFEGREYIAYADPGQPKNKALLTVCSGVTNLAIPGYVIEGKTYTKEECDVAEATILKKVSEDIAPLIKQDMSLEQREMLIDFTYNLGVANFSKSTLLKKINANDCKGASLEFDKWAKAAGKTMKGLVRRRDAEQDRFDNYCLPDGTFMKQGVKNGT